MYPKALRLEKPGCVSEGGEYVLRLEGAELTGCTRSGRCI